MLRHYTYLCAIHALPSPVKTVSQTETIKRYTEGENVIEEREILYSCSNDVQILYTMEPDSFQPEHICRECWFCYDVVYDG